MDFNIFKISYYLVVFQFAALYLKKFTTAVCEVIYVSYKHNIQASREIFVSIVEF